MRIKIQDQNIFFASDMHFGHANVINHDGRPFNDVEEMNERLIENWNHKVSKTDMVFYLGDLSFGKFEFTKNIVDQLNGKIHFILGNHDNEKDIHKLGRFESVSDYVNLSVLDEDNPRKWQEIMMMHYPILSWDKSHHGSWSLHGHCHQSLVTGMPEYYKRRVLDMGCNGWEYEPVSYQEVKEIMLTRLIGKVDHH